MLLVQVSIQAVVLLLLNHYLTQSEGFLPTRTRLAATNWAFSGDGETTTHKGMTEKAILQAAATVLAEYPSPHIPSAQNVQLLINSNPEFGINELVSSYYSQASVLNRQKIKIQFNLIIEFINLHNELVDNKFIGEFTNAAAHFDSEQFGSGQSRLICFRRAIANSVLNKDYMTARKYAGRMLHTLQDFYSHTNWVENWRVNEKSVISPYDVLGEYGMEIERAVGKSTPTCSDCTKTGSLSYAQRIAYFLVVESSSLFDCEDNLASFLKEQKMLTSGYYSGGKDDDKKTINKPSGKCSHGGITDSSTDDHATGGINKDSTHSELAPHYSFHAQAVAVAQKHSMQMLLKIRQDVNNDKLFIEFLGLEENPPSSLTIVLVGSHDMSLLLHEVHQLFSRTETVIQQFGNNIQYQLVYLNGGTIISKLLICIVQHTCAWHRTHICTCTEANSQNIMIIQLCVHCC